MYGTPAHLIIGFHGCDAKVGERILAGKDTLNASTNEYDWLGPGRYFWEGNYVRALEYARKLSHGKRVSRIHKPFVLGAVIDLGHCLNLLEDEHLKQLRKGYQKLSEDCKKAGYELPVNKPLKDGTDLLIRNLDCAVIESVHKKLTEEKRPAFDSVRGVFWEGAELYPNAGFRAHNHIQICVRNPNCIKGYFRPLKPSSAYRLPSKVF